MSKRTRLKFAMVAFFVVIAMAVLKHWFSGISETLVGLACSSALTYIIGDTIRKSEK